MKTLYLYNSNQDFGFNLYVFKKSHVKTPENLDMLIYHDTNFLYLFYEFLHICRCWNFLTLWRCGQNNLGELCQYQSCWCPASLFHQVISSHAIASVG